MTRRDMRLAHVGVVCAAAAFAAVAGAQDPPGMPDLRVQRAIEGELWEARAVDANAIDVDVAQGIATLSGTVSNIISKERAVRIAGMTRGVLSVVDRIMVRESDRSDSAIETDLTHAFANDPTTDSWEIGITVENGAVVLEGTVESQAERRLAERVAKTVSGVRSVDNHLTVDYVETRMDAQIENEIEELLEWDARLDDGLITVEVEDGHATLAGSIGSEYEREVAESRAWVAGVREVDASDLRVEWWLRDEMQRPAAWADLGDEEILAALERALVLEPRVSSFNVEAELEGGTATLSGVVDSLKAKRSAAQVAQNTVGVTRVRNYLKVRPVTFRIAADVEADAQAALARDSLVSSTDISVVVNADGEAMLYGTAESAFERAHAGDVIARVAGVTEVRNYLEVPYQGPAYSYDYEDWDPWLYDYDFDYGTFVAKTDDEIAEDIESELFWSPFVDANEVDVSVENGIATLTGVVDDWSEWRSAAENAREGGAFRVRNNLRLGEG